MNVKTTTTFPRNAWYVACASEEVDAKLLGRRVCGEDVVIFRNEEGDPVSLEDFCPHRGLPLSMGVLAEGTLVCGYHGLRMGPHGKVVSMPNQQVDSFPCIRPFPTVERHGHVWLWPGNPELADPEDVPAYEWSNNPHWAYGGGLYHVHCDYRLMIDNLMDLSHEPYVHADSIGQEEIDDAAVDTQVMGDEVVTSRFMYDVMAPPFWRLALRENGLEDDIPVDRWQICRFSPPSHVMIEVGVAHAGFGGYEADNAHKVSAVVVDFITPETEDSMWYFWGMARNFQPASAELTEKIKEGQGRIFAEDIGILEQQQRNLDRNQGRRLMTLNIDAGGRHSRRIIQSLIDVEDRPTWD